MTTNPQHDVLSFPILTGEKLAAGMDRLAAAIVRGPSLWPAVKRSGMGPAHFPPETRIAVEFAIKEPSRIKEIVQNADVGPGCDEIRRLYKCGVVLGDGQALSLARQIFASLARANFTQQEAQRDTDGVPSDTANETEIDPGAFEQSDDGSARSHAAQAEESRSDWNHGDGGRQNTGTAGGEQHQEKEGQGDGTTDRGKKARPLKFINMSSWDDEPVPEREWAVPDRIPLRQPVLFSGEGAAGKTLVQLQLSAAHVLGRDWFGTIPALGPAIFVGAEEEQDELHRRLAAGRWRRPDRRCGSDTFVVGRPRQQEPAEGSGALRGAVSQCAGTVDGAHRSGGAALMTRAARIPDRGDVRPGMIAQQLGLSLAEFELRRPDLHSRGFPPPDPTTGCYCIEAVDRWRLSRHKSLFPELLAAPSAVSAASVFDERLRGLGG